MNIHDIIESSLKSEGYTTYKAPVPLSFDSLKSVSISYGRDIHKIDLALDAAIYKITYGIDHSKRLGMNKMNVSHYKSVLKYLMKIKGNLFTLGRLGLK